MCDRSCHHHESSGCNPEPGRCGSMLHKQQQAYQAAATGLCQAAGQAGRSHAGDNRALCNCGASSLHQRQPKALTVFLTATRRCGAGATGFSAASLAARLAKFC